MAHILAAKMQFHSWLCPSFCTSVHCSFGHAWVEKCENTYLRSWMCLCVHVCVCVLVWVCQCEGLFCLYTPILNIIATLGNLLSHHFTFTIFCFIFFMWGIQWTHSHKHPFFVVFTHLGPLLWIHNSKKRLCLSVAPAIGLSMVIEPKNGKISTSNTFCACEGGDWGVDGG